MGSFLFNQRIKLSKVDMHPVVKYGFEDPDVVPYLLASGWGETSDDDPDVIIAAGEIELDPVTIHGGGPDKGKYVLPDRAATALGITLEEAQAFVAGPGAA